MTSPLQDTATAGGWPSARHAWLGVVLLMLAYCFSYIDRTALSLVVQPIKASLNLSDTQIGLLQGPAFGLLFTLTTVPFGWLADWMSRPRLIAAGVAVWSVMTAACGLSVNFVQLFLARMGVAVGEATISPNAPSLIADFFPVERRTLPMNLYVVAGGVGGSIAFVAGGFVAGLMHERQTVMLPVVGELAAWQAIFIAVGSPGILLSVLFLMLRDPPRREHGQTQGTRAEFWQILRRRGRILGPQSLGICLFQLQTSAFTSWLTAFFMRVHHWSIAEVGVRYGLVQMGMGIIGGIIGGAFSSWLWRRGRRDANLLTAAIAVGSMTVPAVAGFLASGAWLSVACFGIMALFGHIPVGASLSSIQEIIPNRLRGRVTASYYLALGLVSMTFGPLIVGVMNDYLFGPSRIATSMIVVSVFALPLGAAALLLAARWRRALPMNEIG